jgi:tungstate transport system ATP-binding protein
MSDSLYRLRDVRVEREQRQVLDIPSLEIASGRVTAVVGPNGAGKTTLLRVLAFLQAPASGTVEFGGATVAYRERALRRLRQAVTLVGQSPLLFRRSVRANVAYGLRRRGLAADGRIDSALSTVGLEGFAERPAWKLSGGESQRVAIARALAIDPSVYLFDEPTANIDRRRVTVIENLIVQLGASGKTVVLTTHNHEQAGRLGDTILELAEGRVVGGTPSFGAAVRSSGR